MSKDKKISSFDIIIGAMLIIVVGIMPLIVRGSIRTVPPESVDILRGMPSIGERDGVAIYLNFFSHVRGWFLGLPAAVILFYYVSDLVTNGLKGFDIKKIIKNPVVIASGVFLLFALISTILSDYSYTAWHGTYDRGEGFWIWFAYFIVFFGAMFYVREEKHAKVILWGLIFSSIIMGVFGLSQFMQRDLFGNGFVQWLVTSGVAEYINDFAIVFPTAFGTLYNPNTFGLYTAMLTPILIFTGITYDGKKIINVLLLIAGGLMFVGIFGSRSLGGMVGIAAAVGLIVVTLFCTLGYRIYKKQILLPKLRLSNATPWLAGVAVLAVVIVSLFFIPIINDRLILQWERFNSAVRAEYQPTFDFTFAGDTMHVFFGGEPVFSATVERDIYPGFEVPLSERGEWITVRDATGGIVPMLTYIPEEERIVYIFDVPNFQHISFTYVSNAFVYNNMVFVRIDNVIYGFSSVGQYIDMTVPIPSFGFRGREQWGSSRGYIFSRSFPLLPRYWLIGSGPDSYINVFPQHDIIGKMQNLPSPYQIVDKAHNLYIQTWITTGGISALTLIFIFSHYLITTFLFLVRTIGKKSRFDYGLQMGLLAGIGAFCVASLSTDSIIGSTGVFFVLLGLGYGVNVYIKQQSNPDIP
jgi:hypothetical protein